MFQQDNCFVPLSQQEEKDNLPHSAHAFPTRRRDCFCRDSGKSGEGRIVVKKKAKSPESPTGRLQDAVVFEVSENVGVVGRQRGASSHGR